MGPKKKKLTIHPPPPPQLNMNNKNRRGTPFGRSAKIQRSPVMTPRAAVGAHGEADKMSEVTPQIANEKSTVPNNGAYEGDTIHTSPRQEYISKMKRSEEETLEKFKNVLRKMRQAMEKQKNISMDVKNGVSELEELLDVSGDYRRSWKTAEIERGAATRLVADICQTQDIFQTLLVPKHQIHHRENAVPQARLRSGPVKNLKKGPRQKKNL